MKLIKIDQTDFSVTAGFITAPGCAILFHRITGWNKWISMPIGGLLGFIIVVFLVYYLIEIIGKKNEKRAQQVDSAEPSTNAVPPSSPPGSAR